ncbi:putative Proteasome subunit beta type-1 [Paratrimastix pyriformis]|uniref:Proteasome subunit beta n=1 Tax=Paratrimastix pyriformis TaxID=342808 RepID=A0ABQ8U765_9EUKA|nr:putative Proteasome subunit beta type-1 [Paratrimastix pyriformis]
MLTPAVAPIEAKKKEWSPYTDNGGTTLAIAGPDYAIVAADTRLSNGYSISCRDVTKLAQLTQHCVIGTAGMQADRAVFHKLLRTRVDYFKYKYGKTITPTALAQMIANILYGHRFFPYYCFNVVGGLDAQGHGVVFSYDAVGSYQALPYATTGSGAQLLEPLLDSHIAQRNRTQKNPPMSKDEAIAFVKNAMASVSERDIHTGDFLEIAVITREGTQIITREADGVERIKLGFD